MAKINPFLNTKLLGITMFEWTGILFAAFCAQIVTELTHSQIDWINFVIFVVAWIIGFGLYSVVIAAIKTYITKED